MKAGPVPAFLVLLLLLGAAMAEELRIATMRLGTSWYVFGATLYHLLEDKVPPGTRIEVVAKGGGIVNPVVVSRGRAEIGLSNAVSAAWAYQGRQEVYGGERHDGIRALAGGLNPVWFCALARRDYLEASGHGDLESILAGRPAPRIVMKPRGSVVPVLVDMVLESLGSTREDLEKRGGRILQVDAKQIPAILRDGRADLYFDAVPLEHPTLTAVALTGRVRFLGLPDRTRDHLSQRGLSSREMPKVYPGQDRPLATVDLGTVLVANRDLPEQTAWLITRTLCESAGRMARTHKAWAGFRPQEAWKEEHVRIPLHPGARRYYLEQGWMEP